MTGSAESWRPREEQLSQPGVKVGFQEFEGIVWEGPGWEEHL